VKLPKLATPIVAGLVFGACVLIGAAVVQSTVRELAREGGVDAWVLLAVPGLFAMLFALLVYQGADRRVTSINKSLSRGLLVALLTWMAFSGLATWVWCLPENYGSCYGNVLLLSGVAGGGPMLAAALIAGGIVGWLIQHRAKTWIAKE
jgi:uncharacterized BrkB/YihY/UPF0761 family membrane protein